MYELRNNKWPVYSIPDGAGSWMQTSPTLYDSYIQAANRESGGKLLQVAQLMKFWRECRDPRIPLSSFHIEMVLANEACAKALSHTQNACWTSCGFLLDGSAGPCTIHMISPVIFPQLRPPANVNAPWRR